MRYQCPFDSTQSQSDQFTYRWNHNKNAQFRKVANSAADLNRSVHFNFNISFACHFDFSFAWKYFLSFIWDFIMVFHIMNYRLPCNELPFFHIMTYRSISQFSRKLASIYQHLRTSSVCDCFPYLIPQNIPFYCIQLLRKNLVISKPCWRYHFINTEIFEFIEFTCLFINQFISCKFLGFSL